MLHEGLIGEYTANGTQIKTYGYKPDSTWGTDPVFMKEENDFYWYYNDHLGTRNTCDRSGNTVWKSTYESFGKADIAPRSSVVNNLRFPGQYFDAETGLHYNWNRYYDPSTGRYITADPIGLEGGINFYAYVLNDPVNKIDPLGLVTSVIIIDTKWALTGPDYPHAALLIDNPNGEAILFDPGGTYLNDKDCGTKQVDNIGKALSDYIKYHVCNGSTVNVYSYLTTPAEEQIKRNIDDQIIRTCCPDKGFCAQGVSSVIKGVGPFKDVEFRITPAGLESDLTKINK